MSDKSPPTSPGLGPQQKTSRHSSSSSSSTAPGVRSSNPNISCTPHTPYPNLDQQQMARQSSTQAAKSSKPPTPKPNSPPKNSQPNTPNLSAKTSNPNSAAQTRKPKKPNNAAKNSNSNTPKPNSATKHSKPNSPNHATQTTNPNSPNHATQTTNPNSPNHATQTTNPNSPNHATQTTNPNSPNHATQTTNPNTPKSNSAPNSSNPNTPNATTAQNGNPTPPASAPSGPPPLPSKTHTQDLNYMHRPPRIMPNYGRRQWQQSRLLPKTCIGRVLLYDNVMQQQMLDVKVSGLLSAQRKMGKIMDMHRNSFLLTRMQKQRHVADTVLHVDDVMPEHVTPPRMNTTIIALSHAGTPRFERNPPSEKPQEQDTAETKHTHTEEKTPGDEKTVADPASEKGAKEKMAENGEETDCVSPLPPPLPAVPQDRYGASTSFGFALQNPQTSDTRAAHTAAAYRQHQGRGERGGGGGHNTHTNSHTLPEIHVTSGQPAHAVKMVLHVDSNKQGLTRLFHSYPQPAQHAKKGAGKGKGKGKLAKNGVFDNRTVEDTRYRRLEKLLVRIEPPNEGYLELSPSFHTPRRAMTFTRPNSFRSSIFRRRRSGSARSNLSSSSGGRVVLSSL
ncbi:mucin-5AC-like [Littorina saxatilis]|uniref:Uncharacterized protein n=1 Tax=Littorina saxatilis TaxID=31220 RepID=A0AAN9G9E2_9CAEN